MRGLVDQPSVSTQQRIHVDRLRLLAYNGGVIQTSPDWGSKISAACANRLHDPIIVDKIF